MKLTQLEPDTAILEEVGERLARRRIDLGLTQAALAEQAGLGKRTVERIESGESAQLVSLVRILRVLELVSRLDLLVPELGPRPMDQLRRKGKERRRASSRHQTKKDPQPWSWDDEK
jgi:transcriptional regulator with XRE-family HTH domain